MKIEHLIGWLGVGIIGGIILSQLDTVFNKLKTDVNALLDQAKINLTPAPVPVPTANLYDDFKYVETFVPGKVSNNGKWLLEYTSGGYAKADGNGAVMAPGGDVLTIFSGSVLLRSTKKWANNRVTFFATNEGFTYSKTAGWMSVWPFIRHVNKWQHWYVILGTEKVEIGRKDAPLNITDQQTIERYQFTIWTGGPPTPIGTKRKLTMEFIGNTLKVWVDGVLIKTLVDDGTLIGNSNYFSNYRLPKASWSSGEVCLYNEGSRCRYNDVIIETLP